MNKGMNIEMCLEKTKGLRNKTVSPWSYCKIHVETKSELKCTNINKPIQ